MRFFSSGLQALAVQVLGGVFFYYISVYLSKPEFGVINWMNAVGLFVTTLLGFGLEQVVVRRIAAGKNSSDWAAGAFFAHALGGFVLSFLIVLGLSHFAGGDYRYLPWFFAAQGLVYAGVPLKQFLNAKERFTPYGVIAIISNTGKIAGAFMLMGANNLDTRSVAWLLIGAAVFELLGLLIFVRIRAGFQFRFKLTAYGKLLKESMPQYLSVVFDISLSRMDWILLGLLGTTLSLADYSFAYRAFELSRLPMTVIAPIILPRLSRLLAGGNKPDDETRSHIASFAGVELFLGVLIPLLLNILWTPVVGWLTHGKYGAGNALEFLLLSLCIPLQLLINLLWSMGFGAKKYKAVASITMASALVNVVLNLLLIPLWGGVGAAVAFLATTVLQAALYCRLISKHIMPVPLGPLLLLPMAAVVYAALMYLHWHFLIQLVAAVAVYTLLALISGLLNRQHWHNFKQFLTR